LTPRFDADQALSNVDGDPEVLQRVPEVFAEEGRVRIGALERALEEEDESELAELAHALKGMASSPAVPVLAELAASLETWPRDAGELGLRRDEGAALVSDTRRELERALGTVEATTHDSSRPA